ncbi:endolytic transglycosylase MltG [Flavobacterium sp. SM15]|uniref:endolytic transglycosylase MltG n=1 Tax=Flavobacterium sp. SM15 TaxID=2908005 RepID=UPI001EDAB8B9|nr:endolytic transglycosylase MltG [Flavobacterium sp. SM15]MCG2610566.1 endolytic transglycosylase MltG [Flavobacterium sp. SM15]
MNPKRILSIVSVLILLVATGFGVVVYLKAFTANTKFNQDEVFVYVPTNSTYDDVKKIVAPYVENMEKFNFVAERRGYSASVNPGKFLLTKGMNSFSIVSSLRHNVPVKLAFNNQESLGKLVQRLSSQIEPDSLTLTEVFTDSTFMAENGFDKENILGMFIPNTYEFYWNVSPIKVRDKLAKEYRRFWNEERQAKAKALNLTPQQVTALAAIVHEETAKVSERPRVAGVYLNRLKKDMPLQADPTVIYAVKRESGNFDQVIKRVLFNDLKINSPYNTYVHTGLPPGPISMPDISAIDAVLNAEKHDYIYFCASVEKIGYHDFAATYEAHQVNAKKYAEWVGKLGINR